MRLLANTIMAMFAGAVVVGALSTGKGGRAFYFFKTMPKFQAPQAAGDLLRRVGKYPDNGPKDGIWRKIAAEEFAKDLALMRWTWNDEMGWIDGKSPSTKSIQP